MTYLGANNMGFDHSIEMEGLKAVGDVLTNRQRILYAIIYQSAMDAYHARPKEGMLRHLVRHLEVWATPPRRDYKIRDYDGHDPRLLRLGKDITRRQIAVMANAIIETIYAMFLSQDLGPVLPRRRPKRFG